jgi:hypothetical protein
MSFKSLFEEFFIIVKKYLPCRTYSTRNRIETFNRAENHIEIIEKHPRCEQSL